MKATFYPKFRVNEKYENNNAKKRSQNQNKVTKLGHFR